jgi:3-deoxy-manno-octulosonate cytidylyltransferase (CMP-KDO synthetase)
MKIICFIPSRYDSTRFPGKPLALIAGRPMIQHVYQRGASCAEISEVHVATDDERIFRCVQDFGGKAVMTQKGHFTGTDRVAEAAREINLDKDVVIVNIQGDQPIFHPSAISDLVRALLEDPDVPMSTLKYRIRDEKEVENPNHVKVVTDKAGYAIFFSRSPIPFYRNRTSRRIYYRHLGFYAYRREFLEEFSRLPIGELESTEKLEQLRVLESGFRIKVVETPFDSIEVDTPEDIKRVEEIIARATEG